MVDRHAVAPAANALEEDVPPSSDGKVSLYYVMMAMVGATIGAIAGLSSTSVTNTLLQLIAPVVAGSAGLYFIDRKAQREVTDALSRIGLLGVLFIAAAWGAYAVAANYRYETAHYDWDHETKSLYDNVALAELYGHARNLGIADADLQTALDKHRKEVVAAETLSNGAMQSCELLREDAKVVGNVVSAAYKAVERTDGIDDQLKLKAEAIRVRFSAISNRLNDDAPDSALARERMREQAVASLLLQTLNDTCSRLQSSNVLLANIGDFCSDYLRMTGPEYSRSLRMCSHCVRRTRNHRLVLTFAANDPAGRSRLRVQRAV